MRILACPELYSALPDDRGTPSPLEELGSAGPLGGLLAKVLNFNLGKVDVISEAQQFDTIQEILRSGFVMTASIVYVDDNSLLQLDFACAKDWLARQERRVMKSARFRWLIRCVYEFHLVDRVEFVLVDGTAVGRI